MSRTTNYFKAIPGMDLHDLEDGDQFGKSSRPLDENERITQILNAQTRFAGLDASKVHSYAVLLVLEDPEDADGQLAVVEMGGSKRLRLRMISSMIDALRNMGDFQVDGVCEAAENEGKSEH